MSRTNEKAFEPYMKEILLGTCGGLKSESYSGCDNERAQFTAPVFVFIANRRTRSHPPGLR